MKRFFAAFIAVIMMSVTVSAAQVKVNDKPIDAEAVIVEGRTLVPVRGVFEELGYTVEYDADTKTAVLTKGSSSVVMTAGEASFTANGESITPEVPQQIINSRFMLPLRAVGEALGAEVDWDAQTKTASVKAKTGLKIGGTQTFPVEEAPVNEIELD